MDPRASSKMSKSNTWQRRKNKKKAAAAAEPPLTGPASIHDVPDDLLKLILLRLDSSLWLIYAASTCKRWRGIIAANDGGAAFLGLSGTLHPPAIAGHCHLDQKTTNFVPSPSPPSVAGSGSRVSSLDFLPAAKASWEVVDCHGGLVLLRDPSGGRFPDLVVCDPIARRHQGILHPPREQWYLSFAGACLLDGGISMSNFRVLYRLKQDFRVYLFSTAEAGDWRLLLQDTVGKDLDHFSTVHVAGRVDGSLFLGLKSGVLIVLDKVSLEFTKVDLPSCMNPLVTTDNFSSFRIVHSSGGAGMEPKIARIVHVRGEELEVFRRVNAGGWVLEHSVPRLSEATRGLPGYRKKKKNRFDWIVEAAADGAGFVILFVLDFGRGWLLSVDLETMEMAPVPKRTCQQGPTCSYRLPWPPTLQACTGQSSRRRR